MSEAISLEEARQYFEEFGLDGYRVGQIIRDLGSSVLAQEIDYFSDTADQVQVELPKAIFSKEVVFTPGARYSISHFMEDLQRPNGEVWARNSVTRTMVYQGEGKEYDALHATLVSVPGPVNPELEGTPYTK